MVRTQSRFFPSGLCKIRGLIDGVTTLELDNGITKVGHNPDLQRKINDFVPVGWCCNNLARRRNCTREMSGHKTSGSFDSGYLEVSELIFLYQVDGDPDFPYVGKHIANLTLTQIKTLDCGSKRQMGYRAQIMLTIYIIGLIRITQRCR